MYASWTIWSLLCQKDDLWYKKKKVLSLGGAYFLRNLQNIIISKYNDSYIFRNIFVLNLELPDTSNGLFQ